MLNSDFKEFAGLLNSNGVEYLVVGGYALAAHGHPPRRIDLLTAIDGVGFEDCYARRLPGEMNGLTLPLISLDDFKTNKRAAGRLKDLADLDSLEVGAHE